MRYAFLLLGWTICSLIWAVRKRNPSPWAWGLALPVIALFAVFGFASYLGHKFVAMFQPKIILPGLPERDFRK